MTDLELLSDKELFDLLHSPDKAVRERVFTMIYSKFGARIREYCLRSFSFANLGEDAFQDTMVRFYETIDEYEEITNIPAFLIKIARNLILNIKRRDKFVEYSSENIENNAYYEESDSESLDDNELFLQKKIAIAMKQLSSDLREPLQLKLYAELSYEEIAEELGTTVPSIRNRIMRAKMKLRIFLTPYI